MTLARPETRYAEADGVRIGYQAFGSGKRTLIGVPGFAQNLEVIWENPDATTFFERLGSVCRVIYFDKRGTGVSDRSIPPPSLDARVQDLVAVMRAEAVDRAVISGWSEGGTLAAFFAATFPERTEGLILSGSFASWVRRDDHPWAPTRRQQLLALRLGPLIWGTGETTMRHMAPSMAGQPGFRRWAARYERASLPRLKLAPFGRLIAEIDIRQVLPSIYAPTLVMHARRDRVVPFQSGRYLAEHIVGARFVELPTDDHAVWFGSGKKYADAIEEFLTGTRPNADHSRKLATVLFTDIVDSTLHAAHLGDTAWRDFLDRHDDLCRIEIGVCGGRWIKSTGDGLLATFDSPSRAVRCAWALRNRILSEFDIEIRAGLHTGEIETRGDDITGMAVHQAARIQGLARNSEVLVSSSISNLVAGSGITLEGHGTHTLKGIAEPCELYAVRHVSGG
ncbi:MAG TPA: adenylate/guanylate cyclase domain-containing protein [Mycobacterium sp.]|uniref:adenylate/guanylate cyclase domain-containing protein n=1 Tax=Mycobacterium sp. TaxID=1785 RepID=UPI002C104C3B|nr:adenylate/guanylate cyclase domain-containing protein [Mycobacterium sp.]HME74868.1 adenylate/guanylate cyclase domain-containing protein [Mycobacterium sp.]